MTAPRKIVPLLDDESVVHEAYPDIAKATDDWLRLKLIAKAIGLELKMRRA